jgi:formylglycine-generating enzyme required for sulfatase activity
MRNAMVETAQAVAAVRFAEVRRRTLALCEPLTPEDMMVQSCPEASPAKWHLAHTTWFFESFILREFLSGYRLFHSDYSWLFNSYYETYSQFPEKRLRSSFSRPGLEEILGYREHVDEAVERLLASGPPAEALRRMVLGTHHEEQHQELLLTDILNAFFTNPLRPRYRDQGPGIRVQGSGLGDQGSGLGDQGSRIGDQGSGIGDQGSGFRDRGSGIGDQGSGFRDRGSGLGDQGSGLGDRGSGIGDQGNERIREQGSGRPLEFVEYEGGIREIGYAGEGFCFDNERPRHRVWLEPFALATRLVTCGEYAQFMAEGGYRRADLWLSDGWTAVKENGWRAPLYWTEEDGSWSVFTLRGSKSLEELAEAPVSQVSFYEADAYARWAGHRLPTEFEWEAAAEGRPVEGNLLDSGNLMPMPATALLQNQSSTQWYGDCWEWTASAYLGYPGFRPLPGTLGEYNGKFMSGQMVLRGGSCVTPAAHIRCSYRNFFAPGTRWQFSGIRLAKASR